MVVHMVRKIVLCEKMVVHIVEKHVRKKLVKPLKFGNNCAENHLLV